ncbi:MAG: hypothetical protein WB760_01305 [Xanthobacteraceae bacterium]
MRAYTRRGFTAATSSAVLMSPVLLTSCAPNPAELKLILEALEFVFTVWTEVDSRGAVRWTDEATKAVNHVLDTSVGMTDELKQLNIPISTKSKQGISDAEEILKHRMEVFAGPILPLLKEYQTLNDPKDTPKKSGVEDFTHNLEQDVYMCCGLGPAAYQTTYTATMVVRAVYKYLGRTPDEQKPFFERVNRYFSSWVNDKVDDSPADLLKREESKLDQLDQQLSEANKSRWEKLVGSKGRERDWHLNNKTQLAQVLAQLNNYQESLVDVINGRRLKNPKSRHS